MLPQAGRAFRLRPLTEGDYTHPRGRVYRVAVGPPAGPLEARWRWKSA